MTGLPTMDETIDSGRASQSNPVEPGRLIVWEKDGSWARHLRRLLGQGGLRVYESRTLDVCREMLSESPASVVVAQLSPSAVAEFVRWVVRLRREFPAVRILAVADPIAEQVRCQILETGIVWLCTSPRRLAPILDIIRLHFEQVPEPPRSPEQRIWDELPWPTR